MSSNPENKDTVQVGSGDITITESGGVEITNTRLAEALKAAHEATKGVRPEARGITNICPVIENGYCPKKD